jgi:hypothetical protein
MEPARERVSVQDGVPIGVVYGKGNSVLREGSA